MSQNKKPDVVAIDGPAGSGKSTVSPLLAQKLGLPYLDTGAMYRSVGYVALQSNVALSSGEALLPLVENLSLDFLPDGFLSVNGTTLKDEIRTPEVTQAASLVATNGFVRSALVQRQRAWLRSKGGGVMDGRDIGTNVFPDAFLKIFLIADVQVRAERRAQETGVETQQALAAIEARDAADSGRDLDPLRPAPDAIVFDTTHISREQVVEQLVELYQKKKRSIAEKG